MDWMELMDRKETRETKRIQDEQGDTKGNKEDNGQIRPQGPPAVKEDQVHRDLQEFMETKGSHEPPEYPGGPYACTCIPQHK